MKYFQYQVIKRDKLSDLEQQLRDLKEQINSAQTFIKEIESGNLSIDFDQIFSKTNRNSTLGNSLLSMRDQMTRIAEEERRRNWVTEGLAKFVDILRSKNDDLRALGEVIIINIVKYMSANQGSIYILHDDDPSDIHLEMVGCYAYDRKKHHRQRFSLGEGLAGQAVLEKEIIYVTNVPKDYLKITSGLGEALPKNLMIIPLLMNEKVYGVIELASFNFFDEHHRTFIQKLAESIASTLSAVRINQQTRKLLTESQSQAEQMRSQEEEMRQNMEELTATQEEMQRVLKEVQGKEGYTNQLLNVSTDSIYTVDREYKLVTWNKGFATAIEKFGMKPERGANTLDWYTGDDRTAQLAMYRRVFSGESFEFTATSEQNGVSASFLSVYAPLSNAQGEVLEAAVFAKDVSQMISAQKKAEQLMHEAQQQAEEAKAQEEELRQNMEELSATQDEMQRILNEVENREKYVHQLLNVSADSIFTIDRHYKLVTWNEAFASTLRRFGMTLEKGMDTLAWYVGEEQANQVKIYNRVFSGESFEFTTASELEGGTRHFLSVYAPLRNEKGEVFEAAIFAKDVTAMVSAQQQAEKLRNEAQQQTEEVKAQEEELRQNMEELSTTQEEMQRILNEVQSKERYLASLINASKDSIFTLDAEYKLISFNEGFSAGLKDVGIEAEKGFPILDLFPDQAQKDEQAAYYKRAFAGERFDVTSKFDINNMTSYYTTSFSPLKDVGGKVFALAVFGKDVTELMVAKNKAEAFAKESQERTEEIKAQDEELRQNIEELSATQEELQRLMHTMEAKERYVSELLDASDDMIFTIDKNYNLVSWNKTFARSLETFGTALQKGMNTLEWYPDAKQRKAQKAIYDRALKGESFEHVITSEINNQTYYFKNIHKPLRNEKGHVYEAAIFARDVTALQNKHLN
jgi:PAS domain S-box-containing protein